MTVATSVSATLPASDNARVRRLSSTGGEADIVASVARSRSISACAASYFAKSSALGVSGKRMGAGIGAGVEITWGSGAGSCCGSGIDSGTSSGAPGRAGEAEI